MSLKLLWILALAFVADEICCQILTESFGSSSSDSSDSVNFFESFDLSDEEFVTVRGMIQESRSIIMGIFRGRIPGQFVMQIRRRYPKVVKFFGRVAKQTRQCLKKYKTRNERMKNAADCFVEAVRNRQEEEYEDEDEYVSPVQECLQDAMIESAMEAAPLMARAQKLYETFQDMMRETAQQFASCREDINPFECVRVAWTLAVVEINEMRTEAADIMYSARETYIKYVESMRQCMTPVEAPDDVEDYDEEKRKNTTEVIKCMNEYDSVHSEEETRATTPNLCDDRP